MKAKKSVHTETMTLNKKFYVTFPLSPFLFFTSLIQFLNANSVGDGVEQATLWEDEEVQQEGPTLLFSHFLLGPGDPLLHIGGTPARVLQRLLHCGRALCGCRQEML